jgi:predicted nucleic acid-binding protein
MSKVFLDTNVLVYAVDQAAPAKQLKARVALKSLEREVTGAISTQVLQEFYVVATKKLRIEPAAAKAMIRQFDALELVLIDRPLICEAIDCSAMDQLSFWDGLIIAAAQKANCTELWTEDLNAGEVIRGVRVVNPFD